MRHVIVRPALSYSVLGLGLAVALLMVWRAYETISYLNEVQEGLASYHQVVR